MLLEAVIIAGILQLVKFFVPLVNGWLAVLWNLLLAVLATALVFGLGVTWDALAVCVLTALAAAGIHGTATKLSDYPHPHHNPTPSGTPAQNWKSVE